MKMVLNQKTNLKGLVPRIHITPLRGPMPSLDTNNCMLGFSGSITVFLENMPMLTKVAVSTASPGIIPFTPVTGFGNMPPVPDSLGTMAGPTGAMPNRIGSTSKIWKVNGTSVAVMGTGNFQDAIAGQNALSKGKSRAFFSS